MVFKLLRIQLALLVATVVACTGTREFQVDALPPECEVVSAPGRAADTITVAVGSALMRETLVRVDCMGEVVPGLATSWERHDGGRRWRFDVDRRAAEGLVSAWRDRRVDFDAGIDSATVLQEGSLDVHFARNHRSVPRVLSDPDLGLEMRWTNAPRIGHIRVRSGDTRDLLESAIDLLVTSDPRVVDYAASQPDLVTAALPWNRTYVLLSTSRVEALRTRVNVGAVTADFSSRLADDAVRGDARAVESFPWWDDYKRHCDDLSTAAPWSPRRPTGLSAPGPRRIVYHLRDDVARDLAERIVALASSSQSPDAVAIAAAVPGLGGHGDGVIAWGASTNDFHRRLKHGDDFAYVVALPQRPADVCFEVRRLIDRARWLLPVENDLTDALVPLVVTRQHVIARTDRLGVSVDWYGNVRILGGRR
jgi:hypothetical protein